MNFYNIINFLQFLQTIFINPAIPKFWHIIKQYQSQSIYNLNITMESQRTKEKYDLSNKKTNILRQTIRREHIQSYKKKIRMKHQERYDSATQYRKNYGHSGGYENTRMIDQNNGLISRDIECTVQNLNFLLRLNHKQLCTNQNFEYLLEIIYKSNDVVHNQGYPPNQSSLSTTKLNWIVKQKINSLIYRIVEKVLTGSEFESPLQPFISIKSVTDKILYLLDFPQIMPLWEKISLISDKKLKQLYCQRFIKIVIKDNRQHIFDSDFVIDVISNFILQSPTISFESIMQLLPYISQELKKDHQQKIPFVSINKICMIIRGILQENGRQKLYRVVQQGYQHIFIILLQWLRNYQHNKLYSEEYLQQGYQCFENDNNQLFSIVIMAKISMVKLINRIFVVNTQVSKYLYSKCSQFIFISLCQQLTNLKCREQQKQSYIVCKSHRILIRNIFITINTLLMVSNISTINSLSLSTHSINPIKDFIIQSGLPTLRQIVNDNYDGLCIEMKKEISGIFSVLDAQELFRNIDRGTYLLFIDLLLDFLCLISKSVELENQDINSLFSLQKTLKTIKSTLLGAYSRATQPQIFQEITQKIIFNSQVKDNLQQIANTTQKSATQISFVRIQQIEQNQGRSHEVQHIEQSHNIFYQFPLANTTTYNNCSKIANQILSISLDIKKYFKQNQKIKDRRFQ